MADLAVRETNIPGFYVIDLPVHGDSRGWFKENYQKAKMEALGLPAFEVVQNNFSYNQEVGVTRGLHAEPWEKYISLATGKAFGAILLQEVLISVFAGITCRENIYSFPNLWVLQPSPPFRSAPGALGASPQLFYFGDFNFVHRRAHFS